MFGDGDKKKLAVAILMHAGKKPAPQEEAPEETEGNDEGLEAAMQEWLDAADKKDPKAMAGAFKNAFAICESMPEDAGGDGDE